MSGRRVELPTEEIDIVIPELESDADDESPLVTPGETPGVTIVADSVSVAEATGCGRKRQLLAEGVSAVFTPGQIHGVVSPFATTADAMMRVLAGFDDAECGSVLANSAPVLSSHFKRQLGFVSSKAGSVDDSSVYQNFATSIALRSDSTAAQVDKRVRWAAELVGLTSMLDVIAGSLTRAYRKLVDIGMEVALDPAVVMVSNLFDNLGSFETVDIIHALQRIAGLGKTVIIGLNSLPWGVFESLSGVLILGGHGKAIFSGAASCLLGFIHSVDQEQAPTSGEAVIDLLLQWDSEGESTHVSNCFSRSVDAKNLQFKVANHRQRAVGDGFRRVKSSVGRSTSSLRHWRLLKHMLYQSVVRTDFVMSWVGLFVSFFVCAALQHRQNDSQDGMQNIRGIIFFILSCAMHVNLFFADNEVYDRLAFVQMRDNQYFRWPAYFVVTVIRLALPRFGFCLVTAGFTHFIFEAAMPLAILVALTSFAHAGLLLLVVYLRPVTNDVRYASMLYYAYSVMFSGFLINSESVPAVVPMLSLLRPAYGAAVAKELRGQPYSCDATRNMTLSNVTSYCYSGDDYLELQGFTGDTMLGDALWLLCIAAASLFGVALCMKYAK